MPHTHGSNRVGRESRQRILIERAQDHQTTLHKQRPSSPRPNIRQENNCERRLSGFSNDSSSAGDTSKKSNGSPESREHAEKLDSDKRLDETVCEMDVKSRKKYPELREPGTYGKENCRVALKAIGHKNITRLKADGRDGKRMLQELVSDEWRLNPKMRRLSMRAVAISEDMAYETSDSEEEKEEDDDVAVSKAPPPSFVIRKLAGLMALKGEADATKNIYIYAMGQKYLTSDVLKLVTPHALTSNNAREGVSRSPPIKSPENNKSSAGAGAWYLYLWREKCPNMGGFCIAMVDEKVIEDCVGSDSDNVAPSSASSQKSSSSFSRKKTKTDPGAAIVNLDQGLSSGFANLGAGIAAMETACSANQVADKERLQATNRAIMLSNMEKKQTMLQNLWDLSDSIMEKLPAACDGRQEVRLTQRLKSVEKQIKELDGST